MIKSTVISTIGALVVAAVTYYFFTPQANNLARQISIEYQDIRFPRQVLTDTIATVIKAANANPSDVVKGFQEKFDFYSDYTVGKYVVTNDGPEAIDNLTLHSGKYMLGYSGELGKWKDLPKDQPVINFSILPGKKLEIVFVLEPTFRPSEATFLLKGINIPVREVVPLYEDPFVWFFRDYPFVTFLLVISGVFAIGLVCFGLIYTAVGQGSPSFLAKNSDSSGLATGLALINWLRIENPEKYERVVKQAELTHAKWLKARAKTTENQ